MIPGDKSGLMSVDLYKADCEAALLPEEFFPSGYGLALPLGSPYKPFFDARYKRFFAFDTWCADFFCIKQVWNTSSGKFGALLIARSRSPATDVCAAFFAASKLCLRWESCGSLSECFQRLISAAEDNGSARVQTPWPYWRSQQHSLFLLLGCLHPLWPCAWKFCGKGSNMMYMFKSCQRDPFDQMPQTWLSCHPALQLNFSHLVSWFSQASVCSLWFMRFFLIWETTNLGKQEKHCSGFF